LTATGDTVIEGTVGQVMRVSVRVSDSTGTPIPGVTVTFALSDGGVVAGATAKTDASGVATVGSWTLGTTTGSYKLTAAVGGLSPITFVAKALAGPASALSVISGDGQTDTVRARLRQPIIVRVVDKYDNPVAGASVTFATQPTSGTATPATVTADSVGIAQTSWSIGATAGAMRLQATLANGLGAVTIPATAEWPAIEALSIASGFDHNCAILNSGPLVCWGLNEYGQLGDGTMTSRSIAVRVAASVTFDRVSAGSAHTCALTPTGQAYCWGRNFWGQLGDGTTTSHLTPTPVAGPVRFSTLSAGGDYTCGLTTAGDVYCWGFLNNTSGGMTTPNQVSGSVQFTSIRATTIQACGIATNKKAYCFEGPYFWRPQAVSSALDFTVLAGGLQFMCGLTTSGAVYCWGSNSNALGNANAGPTGPTVPVAGGPFTDLSAGYDWACAIASTKQAWCWGHNAWGVFGSTSFPFVSLAPVITPLTVGQFMSWTNGFYHSCAVATNTRVYCWGGGFDGQLGDGKSNEGSDFHFRPTPDLARRQ
jgi:alpha-tubulin suppressor-like RCC1 family protein